MVIALQALVYCTNAVSRLSLILVGLPLIFIAQTHARFAKAALAADDPTPVLNASLSSQWLDANTQNAWANNDMSTVENLKIQASQDLLPIYSNIATNGDSAWTEVEGDDGEIYYLSWTTNGVIWSYTPTASNSVNKTSGTTTDTTDTIVSIGSYSTTANFLGISMYTWSNIPVRKV